MRRLGDRNTSEPCAILCAFPPAVLDIVQATLAQFGLRPIVAQTPETLRDALFDEPVLAVLVYFGLNVAQGEATCRMIRRHPSGGATPILAVVHERVAAHCPLDCGADDYLVEPCTSAEIILRLRLLQWRQDRPSGDAVIKVGEVTLDARAMQVRLRGVPVDLTFKEYSLLQYFLTNRGLALRRDQILSAVWGDDYYGGDRTVDIHVRRLRAKLPPLAEQIETVHGVGYRFAGPKKQ